MITDDASEENTPTKEETEINNNEPEGEVNVEKANEKMTMTGEKMYRITRTTITFKLLNKDKECTLLKTRMNMMTKKTLILPMKKMTF